MSGCRNEKKIEPILYYNNLFILKDNNSKYRNVIEFFLIAIIVPMKMKSKSHYMSYIIVLYAFIPNVPGILNLACCIVSVILRADNNKKLKWDLKKELQ